MKRRTANKQSLMDFAIQYCGTAAAAFEIAKANGISMTDDLQAGTELIIPSGVPNNGELTTYYSKNNIVPATAVTDQTGVYMPGGIGYMNLGKTFIIT